MDAWQPISAAELEELVSLQLQECPPALASVFAAHRVAPFQAPIVRNGRKEAVFVVAKRGNEVLYYEDVEDGFNFSPLSPEGEILEHWCNQHELKYALKRWE